MRVLEARRFHHVSRKRGGHSEATDWAIISKLLPFHSDKLPVVPDRAVGQLFGGLNLGGGSPFAAFTIE